MHDPDSQKMEEVFLAEALGHALALDVAAPGKKTLLKRGALIGPREIASLAAEGIDRIFVFPKPRVSVIIVGDRLVSPGAEAEPGTEYDFGGPALKAALDTMRIRPVFVRRLPDEPKALEKVVSFAVKQSDIVILVAKEVQRGVQAIQKYLEAGAVPIFCLSYDPDQILERFEKHVRPAILAFMGFSGEGEARVA